MNHYSFERNNPYRFTDPTGHEEEVDNFPQRVIAYYLRGKEVQKLNERRINEDKYRAYHLTHPGSPESLYGDTDKGNSVDIYSGGGGFLNPFAKFFEKDPEPVMSLDELDGWYKEYEAKMDEIVNNIDVGDYSYSGYSMSIEFQEAEGTSYFSNNQYYSSSGRATVTLGGGLISFSKEGRYGSFSCTGSCSVFSGSRVEKRAAQKSSKKSSSKKK